MQFSIKFHFALAAHRLRLAILAVNAKVDAVQPGQIAALKHLNRLAGGSEIGVYLGNLLSRLVSDGNFGPGQNRDTRNPRRRP